MSILWGEGFEPYDDWVEQQFRDQFTGIWQSDAVFTREQVMGWLERGEISETQARILLQLHWNDSGKASL